MTSIRQKLIATIQENPGLPVLAVVNGEIAGEFRQINAIGEVNDVTVDEYLIGDGGHSTVLKSEHLSPEGVLYLYYSDEEYESLASPEEVQRAYDQLEWTKAIFVHVGTIGNGEKQ